MSSFTELDTLEEKLVDYFDKVLANVSDPTKALPSFEDYVLDLSYDVLLTEAQAGAQRAASYSTGALVDTVHLIAAIIREFNMRTKTKAQYFLDAEDDNARVIDFIEFLHAKYKNYLRGAAPEQAKE